MGYEKQVWTNNSIATPVSASRLLHMEDGIYDADITNPDSAARQFLESREASTGDGGGFVVASATFAGAGPHTNYLRSALDRARAQGFGVTIPPFNPNNPEAAWILDDELQAWAGLTIDARSATFLQTTFNRPVFYVPPHVDNVSIHWGTCRLQYPTGTRPVMADFSTEIRYGSVAFASGAAVLSFGSRGNFSGFVTGFRYGVRLGNWSGVGTATDEFREANKVSVVVDEVDFGLVYSGQKSARGLALGSYVMTTGSNDRPHLIYATGPADDCHMDGHAWDSTGGAAFIFKQQSNLTSDTLKADNCPGVIDISDPRGPIELGLVLGTNLTLNLGDGTLVEAVRGALINTTVNGGSKTINRLRLTIAPGVAASLLRTCSLDADWTLGSAKITYTTDETATTQTLIHVYGERSNIGPVDVRNLGTGGVQGLRYTTGGRHALTSPPNLDGVSNGVVIGAAAAGTFTVAPSMVRIVGAGAAVANSAGAAATIRA